MDTDSNATPGTSAVSPLFVRSGGVLFALLLVFCFLCALFRVCDVDVGFHIRTGEHVLDGNGIPSANTFAHTTPNQTWLAQQWLAATVYAVMHRIGGVAALTIFKACVATLLMLLVWLATRDAAGKKALWPMAIVTIAVLIVRVRFFERPDLFTAVLFAFVLWLDAQRGHDRRWQWLFVPLIMAFWANLHGGWVYGFVLLGAFAAADWIGFVFPRFHDEKATKLSVRDLLVRPMSLVLSSVAIVGSVQLINPNGWRILTVPFSMLGAFWQSMIAEFFPPTWAQSKLLFIWMAAVVLIQIMSWRSLRLRFAVPTAVFAYFALSSQRSMMAFVIVSAPHFAFMLSRLPQLEAPKISRVLQPMLPLAWAALFAFVILPDRTFQFGVGLFHGYYPTEIFSLMRSNVPAQNVFNDMRFGGPMLWTLYPKFRPYLDGRCDAYTEEFWKSDYLPVLRAEAGWEKAFEKYHVTAALLASPSLTKVPPLAQKLFASPDWALIAYDDDALLFLKRTDANNALIARTEFKVLWPGDWDFGKINATNLPAFASEATRAYDFYPSFYAQAAAARCAMIAGDYRGAANLFAGFVERQEASPAFWRDYAFCLFQSQQTDRADRVLAGMIKKNIAAGYACYLKHFIALEHRDADEARRLLARAVDLEPDNTTYRHALERFKSATATSNTRPS